MSKEETFIKSLVQLNLSSLKSSLEQDGTKIDNMAEDMKSKLKGISALAHVTDSGDFYVRTELVKFIDENMPYVAADRRWSIMARI